MIEGTKPYKKFSVAAVPSSQNRSEENEIANPRQKEILSDAANPERRQAFAQVIPELGNGLVKLLRASNNLKSEWERVWKKKN